TWYFVASAGRSPLLGAKLPAVVHPHVGRRRPGSPQPPGRPVTACLPYREPRLMIEELRTFIFTNGGAALRRELIAIGFTDRQLRALVRQAVLERVRYGTYVDRESFAALSPTDQHDVMARATLRRLGADAHLSH